MKSPLPGTRYLQAQPPEFDEKMFDFLVTLFAKHDRVIFVHPNRVEEFEPVINELYAWGFTTTQNQHQFSALQGGSYDIQVTAKGRQYLMDLDPVILTRSFIRTRFINYAVYWIQKYIPIEQLPEFLVHEDLFIRKAADEKYTGECSELVIPNELDPRTPSGAGAIPALLR